MLIARFIPAACLLLAALVPTSPASADEPASAPLSLDAIQFLPEPPGTGAAEQVADAAAVHAGYSAQRIEQARLDNELDPFLACAPVREALRNSGSYPSGHSASGWAWALTLAELRPDSADAILRRGREFGESRVVCGVHWPSDVVAGRMLGSATVAALHAREDFREMLQDSRAELSAFAPKSSDTGGASSADAGGKLGALLWDGVARGIPGISAAVATRDGVVWTGTAGVANVQTGEAVRPDMLFGIGSITKTFVAVVVLQLAQEKRLKLDQTAAGILGSAVARIPNAGKATLAQLLNHTGGVPSWEDDPAWIREGRGASLDVDRVWGRSDTLPYIEGHAPLAPAGLSYSYANTNYTLLGMVIEKVTGHDVVSEIHRRILDPLGLKDIHLEGFEPEPRERLPHRYHWATPAFRESAGINAAFPEVKPGLIDATRSNLSVEWAAGGMVATARDLALYAVALRDGKLLDARSMRFMKDWFPVGEGQQVGHNVFRDTRSGIPVIGHGGDVLGFTGSFYWLESGDAVVAVVCNVGSMHSGDVPGTASSVAKDRRFIELAQQLARESARTGTPP